MDDAGRAYYSQMSGRPGRGYGRYRREAHLAGVVGDAVEEIPCGLAPGCKGGALVMRRLVFRRGVCLSPARRVRGCGLMLAAGQSFMCGVELG